MFLLILASSLGLLPQAALPSPPEAAKGYIPPHADKAVHFIVFFGLSASFYFIFDTSRRRVLHLTLLVCTLVLSVGSEVAQGLIANGRTFDQWDVLANVIGSLCAIGLANSYHKRSLERRRRAKYSALTGQGVGEGDVELGEGLAIRREDDGMGGQESGVVPVTAPETNRRTVEEELDNWDENMPDDDWDEDEERTNGHVKTTPAKSTIDSEDGSKKVAVD